MNVWTELRNDVEGLKLLKDWLGDGTQPVTPIIAMRRADACIRGNGGQPCPHNRVANWWDKHIKDPIAQTIRTEIELKHHLQMHVPMEDQLKMCTICGCCLQLAVWAPISRIKEHTNQSQLDSYPNYCWKKKEILGTIIP